MKISLPQDKLREASKEDDEREENQDPGSSKTTGDNDRSTPSRLTSTIELQTLGEGEITNPKKRPRLRFRGAGQPRDAKATAMVDKGVATSQWQTPTDQPLGFDHRIRCIQDGLGSILPRGVHRWTMDLTREGVQHQLLGAVGSLLGSEIIRNTSEINLNFVEVGQYICNCLYQ